MSDAGGDKKHSASERRRTQARENGQVPKSADLSSAALLLLALVVLKTVGRSASQQIVTAIRGALSQPNIGPIDVGGATNYLFGIAWTLTLAAAPILLLMVAGGVFVNVVQVGLLIAPEKLAPKLSNISPLSGVKRIVSIAGLMRLLFGLFKLAIIVAIAYLALRLNDERVLSMATLSTPQIAGAMFAVLLDVCLWIGGGLFILALAEYAFQRWKFEQDLMMTDQEVKEEARDTEGDPQVAARRRQVARAMAMNRLATDVPTADVVVSNPTELAIAIRYDPTSMVAPLVVAKGGGVIAQKIRRLALENGIPVIERKPLARFLYANVDVGDEIPADQYTAVAEVLRYVYELQGRSVPKAA